MPDNLPPMLPDDMIGVWIRDTPQGHHCALYKYNSIDQCWHLIDEFTNTRLPDFMLALAKRIMPK